ncbi:hypothetical protein BDZ89DRAFT_1202609 [Hymenopellis radicata]|nr:hypothetical protein BDZ89DRAFT_1202609 [Hymenopellis radicata]
MPSTQRQRSDELSICVVIIVGKSRSLVMRFSFMPARKQFLWNSARMTELPLSETCRHDKHYTPTQALEENRTRLRLRRSSTEPVHYCLNSDDPIANVRCMDTALGVRFVSAATTAEVVSFVRDLFGDAAHIRSFAQMSLKQSGAYKIVGLELCQVIFESINPSSALLQHTKVGFIEIAVANSANGDLNQKEAKCVICLDKWGEGYGQLLEARRTSKTPSSFLASLSKNSDKYSESLTIHVELQGEKLQMGMESSINGMMDKVSSPASIPKRVYRQDT